ncbi:MAG: hypothetical protein SFW66_02365 [Gammaproteobacteria bacterium]|nr:hypothetical protein [Gammaproteobacteria bacterium]
MLLKKILLTGLTVASLSLPALAFADLTTSNWTDEDSSVKITNAAVNFCSDTFGAYTPKRQGAQPGTSSSTEAQINGLCMRKTGVCKATMYPTKNCQGAPVANMALDRDTGVVSVEAILDPKYKIEVTGTHIDIRYAS